MDSGATPTIIMGGDLGVHNSDLEAAGERLKRGKQYRDLSTVCVVPTRGMIAAPVVERWMGLMMPMNNAFFRMFVSGMEVGDAYNAAVETILAHEQLSKFKYLLTLEEDNTPPPDGLLKLYEAIDGHAAVGGLYWTKGEGGQPMIYGDPKEVLNFRPQLVQLDTLQECNGLGMGFTLFDMDVFRDPKIEKPWFKTVQEYDPATGAQSGTQDLYFFAKARRAGYKVACDTRIKVGHYDAGSGIIW
jgi:hypothetical protein